jgi:acetylornithine deacetylase/succinyl-diaminopimelate desuccinylase-like protein
LPESKLHTVLQAIDASEANRLTRLFSLLRFPSIGTDPGHARDCRDAAEWVMNMCKDMGFDAALHATTGQPVVLATYAPPGHPHVPHVLFYGHYDVQPSVPDELWSTPPFAPEIRQHANGRDGIFARGATDNKGQLMTFVEASRAWLEIHGSLPFRLTLLIEGDEEGDSSHLDRFVADNRALLAADIALVCDTNMWDHATPAIVTSLRGVIATEVFVQGPKIDLHSGYYGGPAVNPIKALSQVIASLHDTTGRVAIPGFYKGVKPVSMAMRKRLAAIAFDAKGFLAVAGLKHTAGETGYSVLEQRWLRPTCEVNGIQGGYTGVGTKTVLPALASAKFTFRLVEGQKPAAIRAAFKAHVKKHLPPDCKARFDSSGGDSSGVGVPDDSVWVSLGQQALADEWGCAPVLAGAGGSIPVVEAFRTYLKMDSLMIGFGLVDDAVHSPNEKYDVRSFNKGTRSWARLIAAVDMKNGAATTG